MIKLFNRDARGTWFTNFQLLWSTMKSSQGTSLVIHNLILNRRKLLTGNHIIHHHEFSNTIITFGPPNCRNVLCIVSHFIVVMLAVPWMITPFFFSPIVVLHTDGIIISIFHIPELEVEWVTVTINFIKVELP
jgi:hypothetical protein